MVKTNRKKQCAIPNCSNPKCPFPHAKPTDKAPAPPKKKEHFKPLAHVDYLIPEIGLTEPVIMTAPFVQVQEAPLTNASPEYEYVGTCDRRCKRCNQQFTMDEGEMNWYRRKGFHLPKRCKECRIANRLEDKEEVIAEKIEEIIWV